jgi:hypothetical protein
MWEQLQRGIFTEQEERWTILGCESEREEYRIQGI